MIENAAKVIVEKCLAVKKGEKVLVVTDRERMKIGSVILEAAEKRQNQGLTLHPQKCHLYPSLQN